MESPNFFAIIPADVRYAPIMANAKLLYGEITALANKTGYCFASNTYFANLYGVSTRNIIKWINQLEDHGFIAREIDKDKGNYRYLSIVTKKTLPSDEKDTPLVTKKTLPSDEKDTHNNTFNNTDINTDILIIKEEEKESDIFIDNIEELRKFLNKGKLMEDFFYKVGTEESFERFTSDFFIFNDDKGVQLKKKTVEAKFRAYLKPRYETEEDRDIMKKAFRKTKEKYEHIDPVESEKEKSKALQAEIDIKVRDFEQKTDKKILGQYRQKAEEEVMTLTKGRAKETSLFRIMVQRKYEKIIIDNIDKKDVK